jgi:hypothetical protein
MVDETIRKITRLNVIPSSMQGVSKRNTMYYKKLVKKPEFGDVVYGEIDRIGQHQSIENKNGRIHKIYSGDRLVFTFANRYAPDYFEALIPSKFTEEIDLVSRSGVVAKVVNKNNQKKDPTTVKILGYVCNADGKILNTVEHPYISPQLIEKKPKRAKMIVFVGTSMNSGKSFAAAATVKALTQSGYNVRASKITGTASLKDIMNMDDAGAEKVSDFTYLGYPATYMLSSDTIIDIFNKLDLKYANKSTNYWVVELADGIVERETAILLSNKEFTSRIHKIVFCAGDALGAIGGKRLLKDKFSIRADAISGLCTATPLHIREIQEFTDIPIFESAKPDINQVKSLFL